MVRRPVRWGRLGRLFSASLLTASVVGVVGSPIAAQGGGTVLDEDGVTLENGLVRVHVFLDPENELGEEVEIEVTDLQTGHTFAHRDWRAWEIEFVTQPIPDPGMSFKLAGPDGCASTPVWTKFSDTSSKTLAILWTGCVVDPVSVVPDTFDVRLDIQVAPHLPHAQFQLHVQPHLEVHAIRSGKISWSIPEDAPANNGGERPLPAPDAGLPGREPGGGARDGLLPVVQHRHPPVLAAQRVLRRGGERALLHDRRPDRERDEELPLRGERGARRRAPRDAELRRRRAEPGAAVQLAPALHRPLPGRLVHRGGLVPQVARGHADRRRGAVGPARGHPPDPAAAPADDRALAHRRPTSARATASRRTTRSTCSRRPSSIPPRT